MAILKLRTVYDNPSKMINLHVRADAIEHICLAEPNALARDHLLTNHGAGELEKPFVWIGMGVSKCEEEGWYVFNDFDAVAAAWREALKAT